MPPLVCGPSISKQHVSSLTNINVAVPMSQKPLRSVALLIDCTGVKIEFMLGVKWLGGWPNCIRFLF